MSYLRLIGLLVGLYEYLADAYVLADVTHGLLHGLAGAEDGDAADLLYVAFATYKLGHMYSNIILCVM